MDQNEGQEKECRPGDTDVNTAPRGQVKATDEAGADPGDGPKVGLPEEID